MTFSMLVNLCKVYSADFDDVRREWEFEMLQKTHGHCCIGAILLGGSWVNVLAGADPRRWDESLSEYKARTA